MVSTEVRVCIEHFVGSFVVSFILGLLNIYYNIRHLELIVFVFATAVFMIWVLLKMAFDGRIYDIALRAAFLGNMFGLGIYVYLTCPAHMRIFGVYMCVMAFFHCSEFLTIAIIKPKDVTIDAFVINHSPQYTVAAVTSWVEFFIEAILFPQLKSFKVVSYFGLCVCLVGEVLRKTAMLTAGNNFNHLVQCEKSKDHILVTAGVYSWFRHPSYVGWFYWSIGTQVILLNPICIPAYAVASWMFFKSRIYIEEITLLNFFGQQYVDYQKRVGTGIPFIKGYKI